MGLWSTVKSLRGFWRDGKSFAPEYYDEVIRDADRQATEAARQDRTGTAAGYWTVMNAAKLGKKLAPYGPNSWLQAASMATTPFSGAMTIGAIQKGSGWVTKLAGPASTTGKVADFINKSAPNLIKYYNVPGTKIPGATPRRLIKAASTAYRGLTYEPEPNMPTQIREPVQQRILAPQDIPLEPPLPKYWSPQPMKTTSFSTRPLTPQENVPQYQVKKGDNLSKIATNLGISRKTLENLNPELNTRHGVRLRGADYLRPGDHLRLPDTFQHPGTYTFDTQTLPGGRSRPGYASFGGSVITAFPVPAGRLLPPSMGDIQRIPEANRQDWLRGYYQANPIAREIARGEAQQMIGIARGLK